MTGWQLYVGVLLAILVVGSILTFGATLSALLGAMGR